MSEEQFWFESNGADQVGTMSCDKSEAVPVMSNDREMAKQGQAEKPPGQGIASRTTADDGHHHRRRGWGSLHEGLLPLVGSRLLQKTDKQPDLVTAGWCAASGRPSCHRRARGSVCKGKGRRDGSAASVDWRRSRGCSHITARGCCPGHRS